MERCYGHNIFTILSRQLLNNKLILNGGCKKKKVIVVNSNQYQHTNHNISKNIINMIL